MIATIQLSLGKESVAKKPVDCNSHLLANNASLGKIYNMKNLQSAGWKPWLHSFWFNKSAPAVHSDGYIRMIRFGA